MITDNRISSIGGGVALFLEEDVDYCLREDLRIEGIENIWVETQNLIIDVIHLIGPKGNFLMNLSNFCTPSIFLSASV